VTGTPFTCRGGSEGSIFIYLSDGGTDGGPSATTGSNEGRDMSRIKRMPKLGWFILGIAVAVLLLPSTTAVAKTALKFTGIEGISGNQADVNTSHQLQVTDGEHFDANGNQIVSPADPSAIFNAGGKVTSGGTPIEALDLGFVGEDLVTSITANTYSLSSGSSGSGVVDLYVSDAAGIGASCGSHLQDWYFNTASVGVQTDNFAQDGILVNAGNYPDGADLCIAETGPGSAGAWVYVIGHQEGS
jgi:hypothetical protein